MLGSRGARRRLEKLAKELTSDADALAASIETINWSWKEIFMVSQAGSKYKGDQNNPESTKRAIG